MRKLMLSGDKTKKNGTSVLLLSTLFLPMLVKFRGLEMGYAHMYMKKKIV